MKTKDLATTFVKETLEHLIKNQSTAKITSFEEKDGSVRIIRAEIELNGETFFVSKMTIGRGTL